MSVVIPVVYEKKYFEKSLYGTVRFTVAFTLYLAVDCMREINSGTLGETALSLSRCRISGAGEKFFYFTFLFFIVWLVFKWCIPYSSLRYKVWN